jgi:hypothetical protein
MRGPRRNLVSKWLAFGIGLLLVGAVAALRIELARRPKAAVDKIIIGTRDEVYYSRGITMDRAAALGHALEKTGFFADQGASVQLSRSKGVTVISFVLNEGGWDRPDAIASFEEIGRRVASAIGGFPIRIDLSDASWHTRRRLTVGKLPVGAKDSVYYFGSATEADAAALGKALRDAGYLADLGATVVLSKEDRTSMGFVVGEGVWNRLDAVASFERLARLVAPSVGGPPLEMRLLSGEMDVKKAVMVR